MVTINQIDRLSKPDDLPQMWKHNLKATKKTRQFKKDEVVMCFITIMSDKRYAVTDADFSNVTKHYEVFSKKELHESFEEIPLPETV